jgi:hypothetical protein
VAIAAPSTLTPPPLATSSGSTQVVDTFTTRSYRRRGGQP